MGCSLCRQYPAQTGVVAQLSRGGEEPVSSSNAKQTMFCEFKTNNIPLLIPPASDFGEVINDTATSSSCDRDEEDID